MSARMRLPCFRAVSYTHLDVYKRQAVYDRDKDKLLEACLAFCIPSTIEGLSITLLEAMSHGRICIASDIPANKEALGDSGVDVYKRQGIIRGTI